MAKGQVRPLDAQLSRVLFSAGYVPSNRHLTHRRCLGMHQVSTLIIKPEAKPQGSTDPSRSSSPRSSIVNRRRARVVTLSEPISRSAKLKLAVSLPPDFKFTKEKPSEWLVVDAGAMIDGSARPLRGPIDTSGSPTFIEVESQGEGEVEVESAVYFCDYGAGVCRTDGVVFKLRVADGGASEATLEHKVVVKEAAAKVGAA